MRWIFLSSALRTLDIRLIDLHYPQLGLISKNHSFRIDYLPIND